MSVIFLSMPVSPKCRCSSFSSPLSLELVPDALSDMEEEKLVDRENNGGVPPTENVGKKGLCIKGKPLHKKLVLSKNLLWIWDLQILLHLCVLQSCLLPLSKVERASLLNAVMLKHALLPGRRAETSLAWNFGSAVHLVCRVQHMVRKQKKSTVASQVLIWGHWSLR